jgi:hypothetical protein
MVTAGQTSPELGALSGKGTHEIRLEHWVALILVTIVGAWARWRFIDLPMRYDESFTVWRYASRGLRTVLGDYSLPNNHVLHSLGVHIAARIGGLEPEVVRLPAYLAGVALIPISFWAVVRIAGANAAVLTAGLVAGWPVLIEYSVNARGYSMAALLGMACVAVGWRIRTGSDTAWTVLIMGGLGALGLWVVPTFLFLWAGILLWVLLPGDHGPIWARARKGGLSGLVSGAGALLLYSPILATDGPAALLANRFVMGSTGAFFASRGQFFAEVADRWFHAVPWAVVAVVTLGFVFAAVGGAGREARMLAWAMTGGSLLFLLVIQATPPPRTWVPLVPPALSVSAVGMAWMVEKGVRKPRASSMIAAVTGLVLAVAVGLTLRDDGTTLSAEGSGPSDAPAIMLRLGELLEPGDEVVLVQRLSAPIRYHALAAGRELPSVEPGSVGQGNVYLVTGPNPRIERLLTNLGLADLGEAELVSSFPSGEIWVITPRQRPFRPAI